jgi:hypothetical protein
LEREVHGWIAGPFGVYRQAGKTRFYVLTHIPSRTPLVAMRRNRDCREIARQLAALPGMNWNEVEPGRVAGEESEDAAKAILLQRPSGRRQDGPPRVTLPLMPPRRPKRSRDPVQAAHQVFLEIIGEAPRQVPPIPDDSPAAVAKRKGAAKGGRKRASGLTPERRREIAKGAARARWDDKD